MFNNFISYRINGRGGAITPWGRAQSKESFGPGISLYSTAGHGGFKVCKKQNAMIPDYMRINDGWYEEDCDWAIVVTIFCERFKEKDIISAKDCLKCWHPKEHNRFYGDQL